MKHVLSVLRVLGLVALCALFLSRLDTSGLGALASWRAGGWLCGALLAYSVGQLLNGLAWRHLLIQAGGRVSVTEMILHDLSSVFWSSVLPGGVAGELLKGVRLSRDADAGSVAVSILCARLVGGSVACGLGLVCLPFSGFEGLYRALGGAALLATTGVGVGGLLALKIGPAALPRVVATRLPVGKFPALRDLGFAFLLAIVTHTAFALVFSACFGAVGYWISFAAGAVVCALTSVAQIAPVTVGGFGVRELTISSLGMVLVPGPAADAAAIALTGTFAVFVLLGGGVELWRMARPSA